MKGPLVMKGEKFQIIYSVYMYHSCRFFVVVIVVFVVVIVVVLFIHNCHLTPVTFISVFVVITIR